MSKNINECIVCDDRLNYVKLIEQYDILKNKYDILLKDNETYEQQLTEKEKENEKLKTTNDRLYKKNKKLENQIVESNIRFYKKGALERLEKVKEKIQEDRESLINYNNTSEVLMADGFLCDCKNFIDNQIEELTHQHEDKGE